MKTRPSSSQRAETRYFETFDARFDALSSSEQEAFLFDDEIEADSSFLNVPTVLGLLLLGVTATHVLQAQGLLLGDLSAHMLPLALVACVLVALTGAGAFSAAQWRRRGRTLKEALASKMPSFARAPQVAEADEPAPRRLTKSRHDRKLFGVCGGIAERIGVKPAYVRVAFLIAAVASEGLGLALYLALAYFLPSTGAVTPEERIRIIRES